MFDFLKRIKVPTVTAPMEPTHEEILLRLNNPWLLACAVGAMNGSIYGGVGSRGVINFDSWLRLVRRNDWRNLTGVDDTLTEDALRSFATANKSRHMNEVLHEQETKCNISPSVTLGPGESISVTVPLR